ncbi:MAG: acyl-CoA/acyl-ACP dehydrogenase [Desulfobacterales bacterium]|nr:acyl-CoA/acyl-ACP dehydrogenase [Desulfobacterales bacterium]
MSEAVFNRIISECGRFSKNDIRPQALEADLDRDADFVKTIWQKSEALDIPALIIPETEGGVGYPEVSGALVLDVFASECAGTASIFANHFCACTLLPLMDNGSKKRYSSSLIPGDDGAVRMAAVVFTPELEQSELVMKEKDGGFLLNGVSQLVGNAGIADIFLVFVKENDSEDVTCLLVESNAPGISFSEDAYLPGLKVNPFKKIKFDDVHIAPDAILGTRGKAEDMMIAARHAFRGYIAAMAMGAARSAYQKAYEYAGGRYQYGKMIIQHQEVQRMLGNMQMKISIGTAAYTRLFDESKLNLSFAKPEHSLVKVYCTDSALEIAIDAVQIHGGYGYMHEFGLEKIMRDVKTLQLLAGRNPHHLVEAVAQKL